MPSGLYPRSGPRPTKSEGERIVYEALADQLPPGWVAWHSLKVLTSRGREGEGDFTLFVPGRGVLLLEVKGGNVTVRDGHWLQNGRRMQSPPRAQAHDFKRKLLEALQERYPEVWSWIGIALCLPQTSFAEAPSHGDLAGMVLGKRDLRHFQHTLTSLAKRALANADPPIGDVAEALHALWGETWVPRLSLAERAEERLDDLVELDRAQCAVLDQFRRNERVMVLGGPGTGKTFVAMELFRRWTEKGERPLFLCSTDSLCRKLRAHSAGPIHTVRRFAVRLLEGSGVVLEDGEPEDTWPPEAWEGVAPRAAELAALKAREEYSAVVVDEAQDLTADDWKLVFALSEGRPLWVFGDDGQGFWDDRKLPSQEGFAVAELTERYRCPEPLAVFADLYRVGETAQDGAVALPEGLLESLTVQEIPSAAARSAALAALLELLVEEQNVPPHRIAILSLAGQTHSELAHVDALGRFPVRRGDAEDADRHVICDTFLRFKGLERPFVIVTELDLARSRYELRMHIALSRALLSCVVLAHPGELESDHRLRAVVAMARLSRGS